MAPSIEATHFTAMPDNDCGPLSCKDPQNPIDREVSPSPKVHSFKFFPEVELGDASRYSLRGSGYDQDLPSTQTASSFALSVDIHDLDRLLPDTQRISKTDEVTSDMATAVLHSVESLPEPPTTRANTLDEKDDSVISSVGSDSQLPDTQINFSEISCADGSHEGHLDHFLPDTQTNTPQSLSPVLLPTATCLLDPQIKRSGNQDYLLPDTQCNIDGPAAASPIIDTSIQKDKDLPDAQDLVQSAKDFPDAQRSLASEPASSTSAPVSLVESTDHKSPSFQSSPSKQPFNKVTCRERKRIIVSSTRPPVLTKAMCQWVDKTNYMLDPFREDDECWLHASPPAAHLSTNGILRPCGKLQKRFNWRDRNGKHTLVLNYGIVSKLVNFRMTKQQKDGYINKQWHLSHLCGNWTCLNPVHTTVEPGHINVSRNNCFSHRSGCFHNPPCMKDKKVSLGADGRPVDHNTSISDMGPNAGDWGDWSIQGFDDGDASTTMDDFEDSESTAFQNGDDDSFSYNGDTADAD